MNDLRIIQVENGFIVDEAGTPEHMARSSNDTHVFSNPEELGEWVTDYYVELERKREDENRRTQQQAEDHNE